MILPPERDDEDDWSPFPWGEIPWGPVLLFVVIIIIGVLMETFDWYPGL